MVINLRKTQITLKMYDINISNYSMEIFFLKNPSIIMMHTSTVYVWMDPRVSGYYRSHYLCPYSMITALVKSSGIHYCDLLLQE